MTAFIDLLIIGILVYTVARSVQKGFVKTMLGTLGFAIALIVAIAFQAPFSDYLQGSKIGSNIGALIDDAVDNVITRDNYDKMYTEEDEENEDEKALERIFSIFGADEKYESIENGYEEWKAEGVETVRANVKNSLRSSGVALCCTVLAYLILFIFARIAVKILEIVLDKVVALPVLKQANKVLGCIAGIFLAVFRVFMLCLALKLIVPVAAGLGADWIAAINPDNSFIYHIFDNGNFLAKVL